MTLGINVQNLRHSVEYALLFAVFLSPVRSCGTPDSLLLTHGLSPTTGQHGGRYDPQPVTRSTDCLTVSCRVCRLSHLSVNVYTPPYISLHFFVLINTKVYTRVVGLGR